MADFCTKCTIEMFGEDRTPDIDVQKEFDELEPGYVSSGFICEGCGLVAIMRSEDNELKVMRTDADDTEDRNSEWEDYL